MGDTQYPVIGSDAGTFPSDFTCPVCRQAKVGEPHSFAGISGGALIINDDGDSVHIDAHVGFLDLFFHGAHSDMGGEELVQENGGHLQLVDNSRDGQFDLLFCSTKCLRQFFEQCVDELEARVESGSGED